MKEPTLFTDFLDQLEVPHTDDYSVREFRRMPFQSCYGLCKLLERYGVETSAFTLADKTELYKLSVPFMAQTPRGFVIVTDISDSTVTYLSRGEGETAPKSDFLDAWTGMAILAFPGDSAAEPDYAKHHARQTLAQAKKWLLIASALFLFLYFFISRGAYASVSNWFIAAFDLAGLFFTFLLVQKSANIKSAVSDKVCGVLEKGGCDSVLSTEASSFFGLFHWSEVGFAYFSVSLAVLLIFPTWTGYLALFNACCLPYTLWSIWYQKFRAKAWCTLCVFTQLTLWCLFFSYLLGGHFLAIFPLKFEVVALGASYLAALLALNKLMPLIETSKQPDDDE